MGLLARGMSTRIKLPKLDLAKLKNAVEIKIDSVREYPGSRKGDFGLWVLSDWFNYQIEKRMEGKKGNER